jgi:glycosyltransferase involved in cell wall biosynthesis
MLTQESRVEFAKRAIRCFQSQTYPDKELVIVTKDNWDIPYEDGNDIRVIRVSPDIVVGDMRNAGTRNSLGRFVATWDDDDVSHPTRLEFMVNEFDRLFVTSARNCEGIVLRKITQAWPERDLFWITHTRKWECSSVVLRTSMPVYPSKQRGSDFAALGSVPMFSLVRPDLYVRTIHGNNVWGEDHYQRHYEQRDRDCSPEEIAAVKGLLAS